jgi:hypothetical protein
MRDVRIVARVLDDAGAGEIAPGIAGITDYADYGDTLLNPQLSASAWARGAVGEDRGRSLAARRSRKGRASRAGGQLGVE